MPSETYYTLKEAAELLKLHPQTLRRWIRQGKLSAKCFGKQLRIRCEDLEQITRPARQETQGSRGFDHLALSSLADLWDNEADAVYDNWKELYGVKAG
jgi:excisionase family DNA binding protein